MTSRVLSLRSPPLASSSQMTRAFHPPRIIYSPFIVLQPTGSLGPPILTRLLSSPNDFHITLLTRDATKTSSALETLASPQSLNTSNVTIKTVQDYTNISTLTSLLSGQDAIIILLNRTLATEQIALINAAIAAQVKQIIPSSFGVGTQHPYLHSLPVLEEKVRMEDHLYSVIAAQPDPPDGGRKTTFTVINNGIFLELAVGKYFVINLRPEGKTMVFDGGDVEFAMTSLDDIAIATLNAMKLGVAGDENVVDKNLNVQTICVTQNQLLGYAKELVPEREWEVINLDSAELERASKAKLEVGDKSPQALRGFLVRSTFGMGLGRFERVDNELLGVEERDGKWMKEYLAEQLNKIKEFEGYSLPGVDRRT